MNPGIRRARWFLIAASIVAAIFVLSSAFFTRAQADDKKKKKQAKVLEMRDKALADLVKGKPEVASEINNAPGYAVFDNNGIHLLLLATSKGNGVVIPKGGTPFYMKMRTVGAGPGLGVKDYRVIFVFKTVEAMNNFKNGGWDTTAEADAAAKTKDSGGAVNATGTTVGNGDTKVYTITKKGVALQATLGGTKFSKDGDLN